MLKAAWQSVCRAMRRSIAVLCGVVAARAYVAPPRVRARASSRARANAPARRPAPLRARPDECPPEVWVRIVDAEKTSREKKYGAVTKPRRNGVAAPSRRGAAQTRWCASRRLGSSADGPRRRHDVDIQWRWDGSCGCNAATPRPRRGYSVEAGGLQPRLQSIGIVPAPRRRRALAPLRPLLMVNSWPVRVKASNRSAPRSAASASTRPRSNRTSSGSGRSCGRSRRAARSRRGALTPPPNRRIPRGRSRA